MDIKYFYAAVDPQKWVNRKYAMQTVLQKLLSGTGPAKCLVFPHAIVCVVERFSRGKQLYRTYEGLQTCKNSWLCPHCSPRIALRRKTQIELAVELWRKLGNELRLVLFTIPHQNFDSLIELIGRLKKAYNAFQKCKPYRHFREEFGILGMLSVLEVTYSQSHGWHPHYHTILFISNELDDNIFAQKLFEIWSNVTARYGFGPLNFAAFGVQNADFISDYLTKYGRSPKSNWQVGDELSKWFVKRGHESYTPFDLLEAHLLNISLEAGLLDETLKRAYAGQVLPRAGELFIEFAKAFRGRHQIQWSRGLKKYFGIGDDDDDVESLTERVLYEFPYIDDWFEITKKNARYYFLMNFYKFRGEYG